MSVKYGQSFHLDHYLEVFAWKPGALPGSTALARAKETGTFTSAHEAFWSESREVNGDAAGASKLIHVLLLHRTMRPRDVAAGIKAALSVGAVSADVVAVEARLHASGAIVLVIPTIRHLRMSNELSAVRSAGSRTPPRSLRVFPKINGLLRAWMSTTSS